MLFYAHYKMFIIKCNFNMQLAQFAQKILLNGVSVTRSEKNISNNMFVLIIKTCSNLSLQAEVKCLLICNVFCSQCLPEENLLPLIELNLWSSKCLH